MPVDRQVRSAQLPFVGQVGEHAEVSAGIRWIDQPEPVAPLRVRLQRQLRLDERADTGEPVVGAAALALASEVRQRTQTAQVHEVGLGARGRRGNEDRGQEERQPLGRLRDEHAVALVETVALGVDDLGVAGVVPEVEGMGRRRDRIRAVLDLEHDGFEQQQVTEDLVRVLAEPLGRAARTSRAASG